MLLLWCLSMIQGFSYPLGERSFFISLVLSIIFVVSVVAEFRLWEVFHKPTTSLFVSLLVFQQTRYNLLGRVLSKIICGRSCHFLLNSFFSIIYLLFFLPEALCCCSFQSSSRIEDFVLSMLIHLTGVLCHLFKFFSSYQVFLLLSVGVLPKLYHSYSFPILF